MEKFIPIELQNHILPFNWDVKVVWALRTPTQDAYRKVFDYLLSLPLWSSVPNLGMLFDVSPIEVLKNPNHYLYQYERILQSNTLYPIELIEYNNRQWVLDGVHRLAKMYLQENKKINIRIHPKDVITSIKKI